jgi:N-acetylglutamate synthase-like GNAT family acetyltransferase
MTQTTATHLVAHPLAIDERAALAAALSKSGLPAEGLDRPGPLFWRFETPEMLPVGFGGLEMHGDLAVLHSIVTLPPVRTRGIGHAIVTALEDEARLRHARAAYLQAATAASLFEGLGYAVCDGHELPAPIRECEQLRSAAADGATIMVKQL